MQCAAFMKIATQRLAQ